MAFETGHALIIGVRSHRFSPGNDAAVTYNDAQAVHDILIDPKKCGYLPDQVKFLHDDTATIQGIIAELDRLAEAAKTPDTVLFFFAGHGAFGVDGKNYYLATHDVKFAETGEPELRIEAGTGLSQVELAEKLKKIRAEKVLMIFNACHSGSLQPKTLGTKPRPSGKSLPAVTASALLSTGEGRVVISACRQNQLSNYYPSDELTFFVKALTDGLKGKATPSNGYISAFNLYTYVHDAVTKIAKKAKIQQEPVITVLELVGSFPVALSTQSVRTLSPGAAETLPDTDAVQRLTKRASKKWLTRLEEQTIVHGDYVQGDKVMGNKIGQQINTGGGVYVAGGVQVTGGDFVGRDQVNYGSRSPATRDATSLSHRLAAALGAGSFSAADLQDICTLVGVDWGDLKGKQVADKARALVDKCEAMGTLDKLSKMISLARPDLKDQLEG